MTNMDLTKLTAKELAAGYRNGDFTAVDVTKAFLANIKEKNHELNAYLEVFDDAVAQAEAADALLKEKGKDAHPLTGIPIAAKDNILIEGKVASAASKILENHVATYDATAIKKLKEVGAVFLGRTNMDEFAMGGSTEHSAFRPTKNPYDTSRVSGGSSGGSAVAVAAQMTPIALGTDTGGSVRQPAGLCGVCGFKPTYGGISRFGLIAMGSSLDQLGIFARSVDDVETVFDVVKGEDENDATTLPEEEAPKTNKKIGVPWSFVEQASDDVVREFKKTLDVLKEKGYEIVDIELPTAPHALAAYYIIMPAEASTNLARYDGMRYGLHVEGKTLLEDYEKTRAQGFGAEVKRRIILGAHVLSSGYYDAYYRRATALRGKLVEEFNDVFNSVSYIATPTSPQPAFKIGEKQDPVTLYLEDIFTILANLAGVPGISVPSGSVTVEGKDLPVGIQFMGQKRSEGALFSVARDVMGE